MCCVAEKFNIVNLSIVTCLFVETLWCAENLIVFVQELSHYMKYFYLSQVKLDIWKDKSNIDYNNINKYDNDNKIIIMLIIIIIIIIIIITITILIIIIAGPQGGFIVPHIWEIVVRKNLTIFKGCHYSWFYIMISSSFREIETTNLNLDPCVLIFLVLGTRSPAAH